MSMDNATMMEIYPYGGMMAFMKYYFLDGVAKQNLLVTDKTRYKHDSKKKAPVAKNPRSDEETRKLVSRFGIGDVRKEIGD